MIKKNKKLPKILVDGFKSWEKNLSIKKKNNYLKFSKIGQKPHSFVISCCDSRVCPNTIFGSDLGQLFVHRNIANLIPIFNKRNMPQETASAIEYAVKYLKIKNIIVLGHSNCGGIKQAYDIFSNNKKNSKNLFIDNWVKQLKKVYISIKNEINDIKSLEVFEQESIKCSTQNLKTFPFINKAIKEEKIQIFGLWYNLKDRSLYNYNSNNNTFELINQV